MKLDGINGKGSGKSGAKVYYVNHGQQIEREYTSHVSNPATSQQTTQRSRFKLASQVSAVLEPAIAIPRKGMLSPRNRFVKNNMGYFYGSPDGAQVTYENLQISDGAVGLPPILATRTLSGELTLGFFEPVNKTVTHVVWNVFKKTDDGLLRIIASGIAEIASTSSDGEMTFEDCDGSLVIYGYGIKARNAKAAAKFGNYHVENGLDLAKLVSSRTLKVEDYMFTATRGTSLANNQSETEEAGEGKVMCYFSATSGGQIRIAGIGQSTVTISNGSYPVTLNSEITLEALPPTDYAFVGWCNNGEQQPFSIDTQLTMIVDRMRDIVAFFEYRPGGGLE